MIKSSLVIVFLLLCTACAHRHLGDVDALTSSVLYEASNADVLSAGASVTAEADPPQDTSTDTTPAQVDIIDTNTVVVTVFESSFDPAILDQIGALSIANANGLPASTVASFSGYTLLAGSIEGAVTLDVNFADRGATGVITDMTYFGEAGVAPLTGQLNMAGQTVSQIGLKLDVNGTLTSELTGSGTVSGTLRGIFHGGGPDGFSGFMTSSSTLPVLAGQTLSGPVYAQ